MTTVNARRPLGYLVAAGVLALGTLLLPRAEPLPAAHPPAAAPSASHRGRVAAISSDDVILAGLAAQDPQTEVVGRALAHALYGIGMHPDAPDLVRFVNALLERARADGSLAAIYQRWYGGVLDPVPQPPPARYRD